MTQTYKSKIVRYLSLGFTVEVIAHHIGVPYKTLEDHIGKIKREQECSNVTHLVATYLRLKLIK